MANSEQVLREKFRNKTNLSEASKNSAKHRNFRSEIFVSVVWLYSKLINPLLMGVILLSGWCVYYLSTDPGKLQLLTMLGFMVLIINCIVIMLSSDKDGSNDGVAVSRETAPALWNAVDEISKHASCRPITRVVINGDLNAYATERKSGKWFGQNELEVGIGLPLMAALEPKEVGSVIAHEIGHHNGDDARRSNAVGKAFERCNDVIDIAEEYGYLFLPITLVLKTYRAGLMRLYLKMSQQAEFDADKFAADVCGVEVSGRVDVALAVFGDEFNEVIYCPIAEAVSEGQPLPDNLFTDLPSRFRKVLSDIDVDKKLKTALEEKTDPWSTHPSVSDRLQNIGAKPSLPTFDADKVAAAAWLGNSYDELAQKIQNNWAEGYTAFEPELKEVRESLALDRSILAKAEARLEIDSKDAEALMIRSRAVANTMDRDDAKPKLEEALLSGVYNPEIELLIADNEFWHADPACLSRLFKLIEEKAEFHTELAHKQIEDILEWAKTSPDSAAEDFPELYKFASNKEIIAAAKKLRNPVFDIHREQIAHHKLSVEPANFEPWHHEILMEWLEFHKEVSRAWIFKFSEDQSSRLPSYSVILSFDKPWERDMFGDDDGFHDADFPLRGNCVPHYHVGPGRPTGRISNIFLGAAARELVADAEPFYTRYSEYAADAEKVEKRAA